MVATSPPRGPVTSRDEERPELEEAERFLRESPGHIYVTDEYGHRAALPETAVTLVQQVLQLLAKGFPVEVQALPRVFSIRQAARLLDVPVAEVVRLLDSAVIPSAPFAEYRRIRFEDLMEYKARRDAKRREALRGITRLGQEMGGYDTVRTLEDASADQTALDAPEGRP